MYKKHKLLVRSVATAVAMLVGSSNIFAVEFNPETASADQVELYLQDKRVNEEVEPDYQKTAQDQAEDYLGDIDMGWSGERGQYVTIAIAEFDSEDPSFDNTFITKRTMKTMEAVLTAKAEIIEFIDVTMSAFDRATTPGTDVNEELNEKIFELEEKMDEQRNKLAPLLAELDRAEAENLSGVDFGDRMNSMMDAAIKKLDEKYSVEQIEQKKRDKFEQAKAAYAEEKKKYDELKEEHGARRGNVEDSSHSFVETLSKQPLFGATTVAQFESWVDGAYQVAVIVVWSKKMERITRALIQGEKLQVPPGNQTIRQWIRSNDWSTSTGGRKFRDNKGNVHFVGIAAAKLGKSSSSRKKARMKAEMWAKKEVVMAIFSDVQSQKSAEGMMDTRSAGDDGGDSTVAAESVSQHLSAEIKDRKVNGLQKIFSKPLMHPISNKKIHVAIFSVGTDSAAQALKMQESNYLNLMLDVKSQQRLKGRSDAMKSNVEAAKRDKSAYNKEKSETSQRVRSRAAAEDARVQSQKSTVNRGGSGANGRSGYSTTNGSNYSQQQGGGARSGSFAGGGQAGALDW